jgi:hypothetical protein
LAAWPPGQPPEAGASGVRGEDGVATPDLRELSGASDALSPGVLSGSRLSSRWLHRSRESAMGGCRAALNTENFGGLFSAIYRLLIHR